MPDREDITSSCIGVVTINEFKTVKLIHSSAEEYEVLAPEEFSPETLHPNHCHVLYCIYPSNTVGTINLFEDYGDDDSEPIYLLCGGVNWFGGLAVYGEAGHEYTR